MPLTWFLFSICSVGHVCFHAAAIQYQHLYAGYVVDEKIINWLQKNSVVDRGGKKYLQLTVLRGHDLTSKRKIVSEEIYLWTPGNYRPKLHDDQGTVRWAQKKTFWRLSFRGDSLEEQRQGN